MGTEKDLSWSGGDLNWGCSTCSHHGRREGRRQVPCFSSLAGLGVCISLGKRGHFGGQQALSLVNVPF